MTMKLTVTYRCDDAECPTPPVVEELGAGARPLPFPAGWIQQGPSIYCHRHELVTTTEVMVRRGPGPAPTRTGEEPVE